MRIPAAPESGGRIGFFLQVDLYLLAIDAHAAICAPNFDLHRHFPETFVTPVCRQLSGRPVREKESSVDFVVYVRREHLVQDRSLHPVGSGVKEAHQVDGVARVVIKTTATLSLA